MQGFIAKQTKRTVLETRNAVPGITGVNNPTLLFYILGAA
jgi:hypothetical protein